MIFGYARISSDDEQRGLGVARQSADIHAEAARRDLQLTEIITENDISASRYSRRARLGFNRIVTAIETGLCPTVIFYNLDRFQTWPAIHSNAVNKTGGGHSGQSSISQSSGPVR